jgi:hypothetical protein
MNKKTYAILNQFLAAAILIAGPIQAAEEEGKPAAEASEVAQLKKQLADQQEQLERLRVALESQQKLIDRISRGPAALGEVTSLTPIVPSASPAPSLIPAVPALHQAGDANNTAPLQLKIGNAYITPVGFMDFTSVFRSTTSGSGIGTNFGSIPYNNNPTNGHLSELRRSAQNSRIGARIDTQYKGTNVLAYWESDFLGNNAGNVSVTSNANTFRMRLYWVDLRKDKWEILGGQSWSMLTPGRKGISPLPADIFYSQDVDVNYQVGLTWTRQPQFRVLYHPSDQLAMGISLENAEQYVGGSGGGGSPVPPANLATTVFTEFNNGTQTLGTPNVFPDIIAKVAWDPSSRFHFEVAGIERNFKSYNPATNQHFYKPGGGGQLNFNVELFKGFHLLTNNYYSDGGGRYLFGTVPDLVIKGDGDMGLIHASSTVTGFEDTIKNTLLYGYYGGVFAGRYTVIDTSGAKPALVGYGYSGSSNSQNRSIQEVTFGFNQTFWKDAKYGALNLMGQYSWLNRDPWSVAIGQPKNAHQNQIYLNLRYTLPGAPPTLTK